MKKGAGFCGKNYNSPLIGLRMEKEVKLVVELTGEEKQRKYDYLKDIIGKEEASLMAEIHLAYVGGRLEDAKEAERKLEEYKKDRRI